MDSDLLLRALTLMRDHSDMQDEQISRLISVVQSQTEIIKNMRSRLDRLERYSWARLVGR